MRSEGVVLSFSFLLLWLPICFQICLGGDTLKANQFITSDSQRNLVSSNTIFELGFFSLGEKSGGKYLGISYHGLKSQTVVWVANRDNLVPDSAGVFRIKKDGNLVKEGFRLMENGEAERCRMKKKVLVHLASGEVVSSYGSLEQILSNLGWERYYGRDLQLYQFHKHSSTDLISLPKDFSKFTSVYMYDIVIKNPNVFHVRDN
ncbi:hypothetical protein V8G54_008454 [Vigna mungo]|uniref:Bulb-type lectin domain-containing protein n=1 Tax=Vigna mungo TaxID=3915 RepID=A0AAQ3P5N0_VIGMU